MSRPIFRLDPGWLWLAAGLVLVFVATVIPAQLALERDRAALRQLQASESRAFDLLSAHDRFLGDLREGHPPLLNRLAASNLNQMPADHEAVLIAESIDDHPIRWLEASVPPALPEVAAPPTTLLQTLVSGRGRLWIVGGGVLCLFIGLMLGPMRTAGVRRARAARSDAWADPRAGVRESERPGASVAPTAVVASGTRLDADDDQILLSIAAAGSSPSAAEVNEFAPPSIRPEPDALQPAYAFEGDLEDEALVEADVDRGPEARAGQEDAEVEDGLEDEEEEEAEVEDGLEEEDADEEEEEEEAEVEDGLEEEDGLEDEEDEEAEEDAEIEDGLEDEEEDDDEEEAEAEVEDGLEDEAEEEEDDDEEAEEDAEIEDGLEDEEEDDDDEEEAEAEVEDGLEDEAEEEEEEDDEDDEDDEEDEEDGEAEEDAEIEDGLEDEEEEEEDDDEEAEEDAEIEDGLEDEEEDDDDEEEAEAEVEDGLEDEAEEEEAEDDEDDEEDEEDGEAEEDAEIEDGLEDEEEIENHEEQAPMAARVPPTPADTPSSRTVSRDEIRALLEPSAGVEEGGEPAVVEDGSANADSIPISEYVVDLTERDEWVEDESDAAWRQA